jgi:hypothetical protein
MSNGDVYRLAIQSTFTGVDQIVNVFHYQQTASGGVVTNKALSCINAWINSTEGPYLACLSERISLVSYVCKGVNGSIEEAEINSTEVGTGGGADLLPLSDSPVISWRTGQSGRRRRGRTYMPPPEEVNQDAGKITIGYTNILEAYAASAMEIATTDGDEFVMVIYSPEALDAEPPRPGTLITTVTGAIVQTVLGAQTRRRQGRGS